MEDCVTSQKNICGGGYQGKGFVTRFLLEILFVTSAPFPRNYRTWVIITLTKCHVISTYYIVKYFNSVEVLIPTIWMLVA